MSTISFFQNMFFSCMIYHGAWLANGNLIFFTSTNYKDNINKIHFLKAVPVSGVCVHSLIVL